MQSVRWGILGCGDVTEVKSGPGFQKAVGSQLVAVMRRNADKAADYARRHNVPRFYDNADALIADRDVDAVYIATPPGSHERYAMQVLAAGKPCYVEKPMARNAAEARRMVAAFREKGVPLFVAYYRRALPRFLKAKAVLDSGVLGTIQRVRYQFADGQMKRRSASVAWRLEAEESGGGIFLDMGSHALDMLDFWFGPLEKVRGHASNTHGAYAVEDHVSIEFGPEDGGGAEGWGTFGCDFTAEQKVDLFTLTGTEGELRMSCFGNEAVRLIARGGAVETFELPNPPHVAQPLIQTVVDALRGVGKCASTGESGLRAQEVMDVALVDYYGGREDGFWKRQWPGSKR